MEHHPLEGANLFQLERRLWIVSRPTGVAAYDYAFENIFQCEHAWRLEGPIKAVARMGAAEEYGERFEAFRDEGVELVHSPGEYERTSHLPCWYPVIEDLTPRSVWYDELPEVADIEGAFDWPVFIKGERQTNRHSRQQSVIENADQFRTVMAQWSKEPILSWQRVVCREFIRLRSVARSRDGIQKSYEFRTFWWKSECVGIGRYWVSETYEPTDEDLECIRKTAGEAARRLDVTFLVVDVAQDVNGDWMVIEVNDGQDSGYAGVNPMSLWRNIIDRIAAS